jgi:hypothetical protein
MEPKSGGLAGFEVGACADLGAFDPRELDCGAERFVERSERAIDWICIMEDRWPDFFLNYRTFDPAGGVPLARHGPRFDVWTQADLRRLVEGLHARGVRVFLGFWPHECRFADDDHPELLMRSGDSGEVWQDLVERSGDLNPMKRMRADPARGIDEGTTFGAYVVRQWNALECDFHFDGLFLGDGGMGFRRHSNDREGVRTFDMDEAWIADFLNSPEGAADVHAGCALALCDRRTKVGAGPLSGDAERAARERAVACADDLRRHHWPNWVRWNVGRWTALYCLLAEAVHARGGELAAYNVMNFDPCMAYVHGADYRALAHAGLDILVFQTYDYAWGPLGPFQPKEKDLATNLATLLATKAYLHGTKTRVLFTAETGDNVEHWDAPTAHTLGEIHVYGSGRIGEGEGWKPVVDGTFVVWANETPAEEWRLLANAFRHTANSRTEPSRVLVWDDTDVDFLARLGPDATGYDHLVFGADGILRVEYAASLQPGGLVPERTVRLPKPRAA